MKIYVASRFQNKERVKDVYGKLRNNGHQITGDWTTHIQTKPYNQHLEISKNYSIEDMDAVLDCDVFILLTTNPPGNGSTTEFGSALSLAIKNNKPKVYVVGKDISENMFFFHPMVNIKSNIDEVLQEL